MRILIIACVLFFCTATHAQDIFAEIGTRKYQTREHLLVVPQPPVLKNIVLPTLHSPSAVSKVVNPMSTKEELNKELEILRKRFQPFMQKLAPEFPKTRNRMYLNEFNWRLETAADLVNYQHALTGSGNWEKVNIPHYGPPLGRATAYYHKEIELSEADFSKGSLHLCFKGVDYKAHVFFNGHYCGSHEGFFAAFEFEITNFAKRGKNTLLVKVENDFPTTPSRDDKGNKVRGDKIYGATGPGYDDPELGWHHCPAGMGIYQDCYIESREKLFVSDIFVRPLPDQSKAEAWVEVSSLMPYPENVKLSVSVFGQNFEQKVVENLIYYPQTTFVPGVGDLTKPTDNQSVRLTMEYGVNYLRIPISMDDFRYWDTDNPWLYQVQIKLYDANDKLMDVQAREFGMRSFSMDTISIPKGKMYLNGKMIRLRGANTMGFEQQSVMRKDFDQLRDDILLARLSNMNFLRFTQRPVQTEVYEMCDMLGMLNQTDLPFFGSVRRNVFAEAIRQAEAMERLVRSHPSTIMVTYINERFPNAEGAPHRSFSTPEEYERLFAALDQAVLLSNPDRVIKAGDGDYDPPTPGLPDSHCYNTWYNGHGLGLGKMYKGYWQPVKPDWLYACGEFGAEGLDPLNVMEKYYPKSWLPTDKNDEKNWTANRISQAQTHKFHYMWYPTQTTLKDWIEASQDYQAWAVRFVTETFRRDPRMVSFAVHLFIDAWPAGWMKTIMDVDRQPKKAFFAYRNALEPLLVSLRSDRKSFFSNEQTAIELWICNDLNQAPTDYELKYQVERNGKVVFANKTKASIPENSSEFQGFLKWTTPNVRKRTLYTVRATLVDKKGNVLNQNTFDFEVFPSPQRINAGVFVLGDATGKAAKIVEQSGLKISNSIENADVILIDKFSDYLAVESQVNELVSKGKRVVFIELPANQYKIANTVLNIENTTMGSYYFVSPKTGHPIVRNFRSFDFNLWYNEKADYIEPILGQTIAAADWTPILSSGASNWVSDKGTVMAVGELKYGKGVFRVSQLQFVDRLKTNPTAHDFLLNLLMNK